MASFTTAAPKGPSSGAKAPLLITAFVVALFFIWGGATSLNDILIPKLKGLFELSYTEAMLTQFAFFTAYAIVSIPAGIIVARLGYGRGIVLGLAIMAAGCLLFVPAASSAVYGLFLAALFVLAAGITILQVAANPLIANLGPTETSHSRLTLAQAFNSLGTTIWPFLGAQIILGQVAVAGAQVSRAEEAAVIGHTYMGIAVLLAVIALVFWVWRRHLAQVQSEAAVSLTGISSLLARPRLGFGAAAIFLYVGAEVTIGSVLVNYLMQSSTLGVAEQQAGQLVALYWGGAMVGRFIGSGLLRVVAPGKLLAAAALGAVVLVAISALTSGEISGWSLIAVGLMNSIMFPTIFSLALEGLGERTPQGSGILCTAIVGGAIIPLLAGAVADSATLGAALIIPIVCYALISAYGWSARRAAAAG